jgi:hypothetical protein
MFERLNVEKHECPHCKTSDKFDFGLFDLVKRPLPRGLLKSQEERSCLRPRKIRKKEEETLII